MKEDTVPLRREQGKEILIKLRVFQFRVVTLEVTLVKLLCSLEMLSLVLWGSFHNDYIILYFVFELTYFLYLNI